jgi:hypothetical protein
VKIGGAGGANTAQLLAAVAALKPQATVSVTVQRGAQAELELPVVTVAQRPPPAGRAPALSGPRVQATAAAGSRCLQVLASGVSAPWCS